MNIQEREISRREWLRSNRFLIWVIVVAIIFVLIGALAPIIFNRPVPTWLSDKFNLNEYSHVGQNFGNYIGPFIALAGVLLTFVAFYVQYLANIEIQRQFSFQKTAEHFYKMLDIHISNVREMEMTSFNKKEYGVKYKVDNHNEEKFTRAINNIIDSNLLFTQFQNLSDQDLLKEIKNQKITSTDSHFEEEKTKGRRVFLLMEKDLHFSIYLVGKINKKYLNKRLSKSEVTQLAYKIFFWGTGSRHIRGGAEREEDRVFIDGLLNAVRKLFRNNKGAKYVFSYKTHDKKRTISLKFIPFSGHASRLSYYYRHLYQTVKFLHSSFEQNLISPLELESNLKTLRGQFMNEEVLLLYYNYIIGFGGNWDKKGRNNYSFFRDYGMIHNVPLYDIIPKKVTKPENHFKDFIAEMQIENPDYRMFEWEQ